MLRQNSYTHATERVQKLRRHIACDGEYLAFGLRAVLIHVDGTFRGRAWVFGCLGGSGNNFPAMAAINDVFSLKADFPGKYEGMPTLTPLGEVESGASGAASPSCAGVRGSAIISAPCTSGRQLPAPGVTPGTDSLTLVI